MPKPWNMEDCSKFLKLSKEIAVRYNEKPEEWKADDF